MGRHVCRRQSPLRRALVVSEIEAKRHLGRAEAVPKSTKSQRSRMRSLGCNARNNWVVPIRITVAAASTTLDFSNVRQQHQVLIDFLLVAAIAMNRLGQLEFSSAWSLLDHEFQHINLSHNFLLRDVR